MFHESTRSKEKVPGYVHRTLLGQAPEPSPPVRYSSNTPAQIEVNVDGTRCAVYIKPDFVTASVYARFHKAFDCTVVSVLDEVRLYYLS